MRKLCKRLKPLKPWGFQPHTPTSARALDRVFCKRIRACLFYTNFCELYGQ